MGKKTLFRIRNRVLLGNQSIPALKVA